MHISIHVPLAGNVTTPVAIPAATTAISIHVPLAGNVSEFFAISLRVSAFLSTFPLRGTSGVCRCRLSWPPYFYPRSPCGERLLFLLAENVRIKYFYPRSPCGERLSPTRGVSPLVMISIHVPLAGNVQGLAWLYARYHAFLSTFPLRGTSGKGHISIGIIFAISIHVPLAGNVTAPVCWSRSKRDFYPRSPCGERRQTVTDYCHLFAKVLVTVNIQFWQRG